MSKRKNLLILFSVISLIFSFFTASCTTTQKKPAVVNPDLPRRVRPTENQLQANNDPDLARRVRPTENRPQADNNPDPARRTRPTEHQSQAGNSPDPARRVQPTEHQFQAGNNPDPARRAQPTENQNQSQAGNVEQRLLEEYGRWKGTRHQLGGTGRQGIDCSGFVKVVYKDVFNINLPRTTKAQVRQGKFIPFKELQPGDLIFFKPPDYPRHVGIFLSRSQFVHASKTKGVTISKIDAHYWGQYYWTARRIIDE